MTREEFMRKAENDIHQLMIKQENTLMNLVKEAWAEGKKNAEVEAMSNVAREMLKTLCPGYEEEKPDIHTVEIPAPEPPIRGVPDGYDPYRHMSLYTGNSENNVLNVKDEDFFKEMAKCIRMYMKHCPDRPFQILLSPEMAVKLAELLEEKER